mgnify:CR=1 FL=1
MLRNIVKKSCNLAEKIVRNFIPELKINKRSIQYLLDKKSVEEIVDYVYKNMRDAQGFQNRYEYFNFVIPKASKEGEILEFGVATGKSINYIARSVDKKIHGFDSFEGFPDDGIIPKPKVPTEKWAGVKWFVGKQKHEVPQVEDNVILYKGWFENTIPEFLKKSSKKISLLHIDCDIYSSTKIVFDNLVQCIMPGTIIMFDEYFGTFEWKRNEFKAFHEFVEKYHVIYDYIAYTDTGSVALKINAITN